MTNVRPSPRSRPVAKVGHEPGVAEHGALVDAVVQTSFTVVALLHRVGAEHDLSLTQLRLLAMVRDRRLTMTQMADHLGLDKSTMTGLVDRAAKRGLVERVASPTDGRAIDVCISAEGASVADRIHAQVARTLSPMTSVLSTGERHRLQVLLDRLLAGPRVR